MKLLLKRQWIFEEKNTGAGPRFSCCLCCLLVCEVWWSAIILGIAFLIGKVEVRNMKPTGCNEVRDLILLSILLVFFKPFLSMGFDPTTWFFYFSGYFFSIFLFPVHLLKLYVWPQWFYFRPSPFLQDFIYSFDFKYRPCIDGL